ncbi:tetratricopeptide repeat protein [Dactylosporangium sp. NPDC049525]|uniref:tetratricopeptide repeat protein n=1 Tax=Dactylosporangium sp. NPDC049525 TaxID=3154730 RepID=UPI00341DF4C4
MQTLADLHQLLRLMRLKAPKPSYRDIHRNNGPSPSAISDVFNNSEKVPTRDFVERYVKACGAADELVEACVEAWYRVTAAREEAPAQPSPPVHAGPPYAYVETIENIVEIGRTLLRGDRPEAARMVFEAVLAGRSAALGTSHPATLEVQLLFARSLAVVGDHQLAIAMFVDVWQFRRATLGAQDASTLQAANALANAYASAGDVVAALELHQMIRTIREKTLGTDDYDTLQSLNNEAGALEGLGQYESALALHERVLRIRERTLGTEHPATQQSARHVHRIHQKVRQPPMPD